MKYDIFISYSRKDFDEVNHFVGMQKECIIRSSHPSLPIR